MENMTNIQCPRCGITHDSLHTVKFHTFYGGMKGYCSSCIIDTAEHFAPLEESNAIPTTEEMYEVWSEDLDDPYGAETSLNDQIIDEDDRNNQ